MKKYNGLLITLVILLFVLSKTSYGKIAEGGKKVHEQEQVQANNTTSVPADSIKARIDFYRAEIKKNNEAIENLKVYNERLTGAILGVSDLLTIAGNDSTGKTPLEAIPHQEKREK